jgi:hypothetical protein
MIYHENTDDIPDLIYFDLDENDYAETIIVLANSTSEVDYDIYYYDNDQDGKYDEVGYEYDLDNEVDKVVPYT